ncbi:XylB Sugar (pentulose and hexulose) kinases [Candidatus Nanopelagicaceae bacterium]
MANRQLIAGVDSSTQSVKVVIRDAHTGELVRQGRASHPDGTEVDPAHWLSGLHVAFADAGGLDDVEAISIAGQQHGMVAIDAQGEVIRKALLWNDTRSAKEADDLNREVGGDQEIARKVGSKLVASFTASKVRWMADHEPENAARVASIALPHDWLSWLLQGGKDLSKLFTDRSDASGTGYFDPSTSHYREDIVRLALRHDQELTLPRIIQPAQFGGTTLSGIPIAAGAGDNAGAALGLQAQPGDVIVSLGTSGTAFAVSETPTHDASGAVAGFADATGRYLPLVCTLNAARILDAACRILGKNHDEVAQLALAAKPGANGLTLLPYFEGERTPNRPKATGVFAGMNLNNSNQEDIARAMVEGMLAGLADAVDALVALGVGINRILLIGGAAKNPAVPVIASALFGREVLVPPAGEYVADGAAKQAAWALLGEMPTWNLGEVTHHTSSATPDVMARYKELKNNTQDWS